MASTSGGDVVTGVFFSSYPVTEVKCLRFRCSQPALHDHTFHQFFVLTQGGGTHSLDEDTREVQAPVVLVAPKGRKHLYLPTAQSEGWSLGFTSDQVPGESSLLFLNTVSSAGIAIPSQGLAERLCSLARIVHESRMDHLSTDRLVQSHLLAAFIEILRRSHADQPARATGLSPAEQRLTERFLLHLDLASQSHWDGARFARELRCSRRKLAGLCQRVLGQPIHSAMEENRMRQARALLSQGEISVQQIALQLGYPDPSYFTKAFRRVVGMTPSAYRDARAERSAPAPETARNYHW